MTIKNVVLVGANGKVGPHILKALLDTQQFNVTVLSRASSKSEYSSAVRQARVSDPLPHDELVKVFQDQDALIIAFAGLQTAESLKLINAASDAGVQRIIPNDFGSCDSSDPVSLDLIPLYGEKKKVRDHLEQLAQGGKLTWTSIITGHFFDFGLESGLLAVDLKKRKIRIFDGGNIKWSATMLPTIGLATARILQKEEQFHNQLLYIQSVSMTQNELHQALERVTGKTFEVTHHSSDDYIKEHKALLQEKGMDHDILEELVCVGGIVNADWEKKPTFANDGLELPKENLDEMIKEITRHNA